MWLVSAVAVAVLNLDAAVVLCTPLAITVARRWGLDPVAMAFQPALLACLASSALPVSNLTNLIAIAEGRLDAGPLVLHLALPTVVAVVVGYAGWRAAFRGRRLHPLTPAVTERPRPGPCSPAPWSSPSSSPASSRAGWSGSSRGWWSRWSTPG
jgi:Na+/H+ antiporter NhaD/arsenite permease-like protein